MAMHVATFLAILSTLQVQISAAEETKCGNQTFKIPGGNFSCDAVMLSDCSCGNKYPQALPTSRVYGSETGVNEFPMMALVKRLHDDRWGGTIISKRFVLTAAHAVWRINRTEFIVYVGEHDIKTNDESPATQRFAVDEIITHEKFVIKRGLWCQYYGQCEYDFLGYDIGLLRLDHDIQFSERVGPVCLPFKYTEHDFTGSVFTMVGWGITSTGKYPNKLQKKDVNLISFESCKSLFPPLQPTNICSRGKDFCDGDGGGPLLYTEPGTGRQFIIAVIGGGSSPRCGIEGEPGIDMSVVPFLQWIMNHTPGVQYCAK